MTQELLDLKEAIANHDLDKAMAIVYDLEVMGREDKIQKIQSHLIVMLVHLVKMQLEQRLTNSWRSSILNSLLQIKRTNRMGNKETPYIKEEDWEEEIAEVMPSVYLTAATDVFGGVFSDDRVEERTNQKQLNKIAILLLQETFRKDSNVTRENARALLNSIQFE